MDTLLVTWIAPCVENLTQLAWLNELGRIQKIPGVVVLTVTGDKVVRDDVATILRSPADVVVWSGHGAPGGLVLSDNSLVRAKWLASQVAQGGRTKIVILASCSSQLRDKSLNSLTEAICRAGINVIGFPAEAGDVAAGTFTVEYVRALSANKSVAEAFDVALEEIANEPTASGVFLTPGIRNIPFSLEDRLADIAESLARVELALNMRTTPMATIPEGAPEWSEEKASGIQSLKHNTETRIRSGHIRGIGGKE